jgi:hypothetical protein
MRGSIQSVSAYKRLIVMIMLSGFFPVQAFSQVPDSTRLPQKTEAPILQPFPDSMFTFNVTKPIPKRAGLYSACLPGLGQLYNKQYWKAGLVYVGAAVVTGFTVKNYQDYNKYRKIYIGMIDSNPETPNTYNNYTVDDVKFLRDGFRKYLEYSILSAGLGYMINILDAFISAHLACFDMNKDISFHTMPVLNNNNQLGLQISFCIK